MEKTTHLGDGRDESLELSGGEARLVLPQKLPRCLSCRTLAEDAEGGSARHRDDALEGSHARPFVGVSQKSIDKRTGQLLSINAHKMAPRTTRWLQERQGDAPTKGLAWCQEWARVPSFMRWRGASVVRSNTEGPGFMYQDGGGGVGGGRVLNEG